VETAWPEHEIVFNFQPGDLCGSQQRTMWRLCCWPAQRAATMLKQINKLAEREGFEPSVPRKEDNGFRVLILSSRPISAYPEAWRISWVLAYAAERPSRAIPLCAKRSGGNSGGNRPRRKPSAIGPRSWAG
jgi:hypothetical protein